MNIKIEVCDVCGGASQYDTSWGMLGCSCENGWIVEVTDLPRPPELWLERCELMPDKQGCNRDGRTEEKE